jgi:hypothetical protein
MRRRGTSTGEFDAICVLDSPSILHRAAHPGSPLRARAYLGTLVRVAVPHGSIAVKKK